MKKKILIKLFHYDFVAESATDANFFSYDDADIFY